MANLQLKAIKKSYDNVNVIHGIDLEIKEGEFVVFVGPSGCGKSTLLRMIAGLEEITQGHLLVDGVDMTHQPATERGIAMVFQSYALYPNMTVRGNLSYPLEVSKRPKAEIKQRVELTAQKLHLNELLDRMPRALSGGQRQRVAIGRAIIREPRIFLFDEPLSNLDAELRLEMRIEIAKLHESLGNTMIYVTHDQLEAMTLADRMVVLRQGVIEQVGAPLELYHNPDNMFVAGFIGSPRINFMAADVVATTEGQVQLRIEELAIDRLIMPVQQRLNEGEKVWLGVRPEHFVSADGADCHFSSTLTFAEHLGHTNYLYVDYAQEKTLVIEQRELEQHTNGDSVTFGINAQQSLLFAQSGERIR